MGREGEGVTARSGNTAETGEKICRFCAIIRGETPALAVFEDEVSLAFLDRYPLFPGHTLLVPKTHLATLAELPDSLTGRFFGNARLLAQAVEAALEAEGTFVAMNNRVSQSVPHLHVHIVPRRRHDGLKGFFWPRHKYRDEAEAERVAQLLRGAVARLGTAHK